MFSSDHSNNFYVVKMFQDAGMETKITMTTDLETAVKDADFVITTIRPGMSDGRFMDETIPFKHGLIGQENTKLIVTD